jgi:AcrR family transcriptional regulator
MLVIFDDASAGRLGRRPTRRHLEVEMASRDLETISRTPHPVSGRIADAGELSFSDHLHRRADDFSLPKRKRTRNRFKAGAARILESEGYHGLQMSRVCKMLGLSQGSIYNYFKDKKELALEVMTEFCELQFDRLLEVHPTGDAFQRVYLANLAHVESISQNVGLTRCLSHLCDEMPEFNEQWHRLNYGYCMLLARSLQKRTDTGNWSAALALARAMGVMVDGIIHEVYVRRNPDFGEFGKSPEKLAEFLTVLWFRTAFGVNPESDALDPEYPILEISLAK